VTAPAASRQVRQREENPEISGRRRNLSKRVKGFRLLKGIRALKAGIGPLKAGIGRWRRCWRSSA
jgi:hypothetical protein